MNRMTFLKVFTALLVLAIPGKISTRSVFSADAWACVPTCRKKTGTANTVWKAREGEIKQPRGKLVSSLAVSRHDPKHSGLPTSLSSSSLPFFDQKSTGSLANRASVGPSSKATYAIKGEKENNDAKLKISKPPDNSFFIRPALFVDMDRASKILADGFFKGPKSNWFTFQYEKFITYLSLEANFPNTEQQRSRYEIFVACCVKTGEVWGFVEIDARGTMAERTSKVYEKSGGSPYMCNLAVDEKHQRKGIATSLVYECERKVKEWYSDDENRRKKEGEKTINNDIVYNNNTEMIKDAFRSIGKNTPMTKNLMSSSVCLKVRERNKAAVQMYLKLGYLTVFEEIEDPVSCDNILLMRKELQTVLEPPSLVSEFASK